MIKSLIYKRIWGQQYPSFILLGFTLVLLIIKFNVFEISDIEWVVRASITHHMPNEIF